MQYDDGACENKTNQNPRPFPWLDALALTSLGLTRTRSSTNQESSDYLDFLKTSNDALKGFLKYHASNRVTSPIAPLRHTLWSAGSTTLYAYHQNRSENVQAHVLCIPSLINTSAIFDRIIDPSFMTFLQEQNIEPFLVDWGRPSLAESSMDASDYIVHRLIPAYNIVRARSTCPVYVLGYCLGGIMALGLACHAPIDGLILMATPWDFSAYPESVRLWASWAWTVTQHIGCFPGFFFQQGFQAFHGFSVVQKFQKIASQSFLNSFVNMEDWLNDPVSLGDGLARSLFQDWFLKNQPYNNQWHVQGSSVHLSTITCPVMRVESNKDTIVPAQVSRPLQAIPDSALIQADVGHVGLMTSKDAPQKVWQPLSSWVTRAAF